MYIRFIAPRFMKYMLGYKIVPTPIYNIITSGILESKCKTHQYFSSEK